MYFTKVLFGFMLGQVYFVKSYSTSYNYYGNLIGEPDEEHLCGGDILVKAYEFVSASVPFSAVSVSSSSCEWKIQLDNTEEGPHLPLQLHVTNNRDKKLREINVFDGSDASSSKLQPYAKDKYQASGTRLFVQVVYAPKPYATFLFNATAKIKGYCPGMYSCGDGETCYTKTQKCNGDFDCEETMADERGCNGCDVNKIWCGVSDDPKLPSCFEEYERCNYNKMCPFPYLDELNCKSCKPGKVLCNISSTCIYERALCDGIANCKDGSDEHNCLHTSTRRVITAAIIGSLVCGLLFVIALGFTCKLYSLRVSHQRRINSYRSTPLSRVERALFEREAPPTYDMTIEGRSAESHHTSSRRQRSRRYQFRRAIPAQLPNENVLPSSRDDGVQNDPLPSNQEPTSPRGRVTSLVLESVPDLVNVLLFSNSGNNTTTCTNTDPHLQIESTQNNCASANTNPSSSSRRQALSRTRSEGSSSRARSSRRRSRRSRDVQAHRLPTKKRIVPVMVPAPHLSEAVEETTTCLYPTPPSYDQAVTDSPPHDTHDHTTMTHSASMPTLDSEQTNAMKSSESKISFKNPISTILKLASPKRANNQTTQTTPRRKLFDFKLKTPSFFRSDPGYSRMRGDSVPSLNEMMSQAAQNDTESSSDEEILDATAFPPPNVE